VDVSGPWRFCTAGAGFWKSQHSRSISAPDDAPPEAMIDWSLQ
jgi:hypothetical protein